MAFPVDFGFFPSTLAEDGDPLDAIILLDESLAVGTKVTARAVDAIKAEEREKDGKWDRNDRVIAIATHAKIYKQVQSLANLVSNLLDSIERFFEEYNQQHGKEFRVKARLDAVDAHSLVKKARKTFSKKKISAREAGRVWLDGLGKNANWLVL